MKLEFKKIKNDWFVQIHESETFFRWQKIMSMVGKEWILATALDEELELPKVDAGISIISASGSFPWHVYDNPVEEIQCKLNQEKRTADMYREQYSVEKKIADRLFDKLIPSRDE